MLQAVTQKAAGLLDSSHLVWNVWLEWETSRDDVDRIHDLYIERLQTPHDTIQATSDAYSTFCSTHAPNDYEARLVRATAAAQASKAVLAERRFGKARSDYEDALVRTASFVSTSLTLTNRPLQKTKPLFMPPTLIGKSEPKLPIALSQLQCTNELSPRRLGPMPKRHYGCNM